jgi:hypothetical protein
MSVPAMRRRTDPGGAGGSDRGLTGPYRFNVRLRPPSSVISLRSQPRRDATVAQVAIAWTLELIPIEGTDLWDAAAQNSA